jgi:CheY-like chemotaxis protein
MSRTALVVDDEPANREFLERLLAQAKFQVEGAGSAKAALDAVDGWETLTLAVVDMKLPDMNGLQLTAELRKRFPNAYIIIATMYDDRTLMDKAFISGCDVFLVKPHGFMELFQRLLKMTFDVDMERQNLIIDQFGPRPFRRMTT